VKFVETRDVEMSVRAGGDVCAVKCLPLIGEKPPEKCLYLLGILQIQISDPEELLDRKAV
jgi:hypothetical protein